MTRYTGRTMIMVNYPVIIFTLCCVVMSTGAFGGNYSEVLELLRHKLGSDRYSTDLRPLINQSIQMDTSVSFSLIGIVEVDDVTQKFTINGYFTFRWKDELLRWDPTQYGGVKHFHVHPTRIWRPQMVLLNSLDEEPDPFGNDGSSTKVHSDGSVEWNPGGLLLTTCQLNMEKFPFDTQSCHLMMCVMYYHIHDLRLTPSGLPGEVSKHIYGQNKGWTLEEMEMDITERSIINSSDTRSCLYIKVRVKRRPRFSVITILLPLVFLSFLNVVVFLIPIDSEERITYAITVLLAISVMMGTVSTLVPQASDIMPAITIYLFILLIGACASVMATIGIEVLHHRHQHKTHQDKGLENENRELSQFVNVITPSTANQHGGHDTDVGPGGGQNGTSNHGNVSDTKQRPSSRRIRLAFGRAFEASPQNVNKACFVVTCIFWSVASLWYFSIAMW